MADTRTKSVLLRFMVPKDRIRDVIGSGGEDDSMDAAAAHDIIKVSPRLRKGTRHTRKS